jgi:hypothetical protein
LDRLGDLVPLLDPTAPPRVLNRDGALSRGYSRNAIRHRLENGEWRRILPRTYLTSDTFTWNDRLAAALAFAGRDAVLSGAAAPADLGLRAVRVPASVLVLVPRSTAVRFRGWVQVRRTNRLPEPALHPGPRRAVADLALQRRRLDDVRALVAEAMRRNLCTAGVACWLTARTGGLD